jgi:F420-non-reducing hydrogenase iron-sulfur subunit
MDFEPKIIGFLCNWCSYAGADLAGVSRYQYPSNVLPVRVMCTGRLSPAILLEPFLKGCDGVLVAGCHLGDCHYQSGNYRVKARIEFLKKILPKIGIEEERLLLDWISASEGAKFAETIKATVSKIKELGQLKLGSRDILRLKGAIEALNSERVRWLTERLNVLTDEGADVEKLKNAIVNIVHDEIERGEIISILETKPKTIPELGEILGIEKDIILKHVLALRKRGIVIEGEEVNQYYKYELTR